MVRRRKKVLIGILIFILVLILFAISAYAYVMKFSDNKGKPGSQVTVPQGTEINEDDPVLKNRVSVLLIGADERPGEESFNTDSIILASIDPDNQRISLLSIPRDTRIKLKGEYLKINSVAALTDLQTLQQTVSDLTGVPISGYIQTNFEGFKSIINTLGGITVDVEKNMYYVTGDKEDGVINLKKGVQRLDGDKALQYARFRHDALADISRTARQQKVLKAVAKEMMQMSTIPKIPTLIPQLKEAVHTNLGLADMVKLAKVAVKFDSSSVVSQTLPGGFLNDAGVSYWNVDPDEVKQVISDLFQGITTDKVIDHETIDINKPVEVDPANSNSSDSNDSIPVVPGNSQDPNGQASPGHNDSAAGTQKTSSDQGQTGNSKTQSNRANNEDAGVTDQSAAQGTETNGDQTSGSQTTDNQSKDSQNSGNSQPAADGSQIQTAPGSAQDSGSQNTGSVQNNTDQGSTNDTEQNNIDGIVSLVPAQ